MTPSRFRPRFTLRRLMVAVAIVGFLLGGVDWCRRRHDRFAGLASLYDRELEDAPAILMGPSESELRRSQLRRWNYLRTMVGKYDRTARYPWLPVAPDPPEPK